MLPANDTVIHEIELELIDSNPTISHDVELTYVGKLPGGPEEDKFEVIATGEIVEPELLIQTATEDILIERSHPAIIVAQKDEPEEKPMPPMLAEKEHMESVFVTPTSKSEIQESTQE